MLRDINLMSHEGELWVLGGLKGQGQRDLLLAFLEISRMQGRISLFRQAK